MKRKNEVSYYPEITQFIESQFISNFLASGITDVSVIWKNGELTSKIKEMIRENPEKCNCLQSFCNNTPPLNLDIFGVITDGTKFEIIILEVKLLANVGLAEWSQLLGYSLVSKAKFGILINIDAGVGKRLEAILTSESDASKINRRIESGQELIHLFGFMQWNSLTKNFEYSNLGQLSTLSEISRKLVAEFNH